MGNQVERSTQGKTVAAHLVDVLEENEIEHVYELIGGMITILVDQLHSSEKIKVHSMHHEQSAAFAAEASARVNGKFGVALATSGPGATNLITGIGSCYFDSVPAVFITGQVNVSELTEEKKVRQTGFQETDIVSIVTPITKFAVRVNSPEDFPEILSKAIEIATTGRKGPVLIDIPMDIQRSVIKEIPEKKQKNQNTVSALEIQLLQKALKTELQLSTRPLILAGGGIASGNQIEQFRKFVETVKIPVVKSLMGIDSLESQNRLNVGFLGSYGNRWANLAIANSDLLIVVGSRLDVRQTGSDLTGFKGTRRVFQIDIDENELNYRIAADYSICISVEEFLKNIDSDSLKFDEKKLENWLLEINGWKELSPHNHENIPTSGLNPNSGLEMISKVWDGVSVFVTDVGQHQMWSAQSLSLGRNQKFLTSGGMGAMGFGLPAAIGAAFEDPLKPVCLIAGDGGFQLNIQELETVKRNFLNLRIIILNNKTHGMVRQFQESYFSERYGSTIDGYSTPSFVELAKAYGIEAKLVSTEIELITKLEEYKEFSKPLLLEIEIDRFLNVYPKMAFGQKFGDMEPNVKPTEMEGT